MTATLPELPPTFASTCRALHAVAEHVVAAARFNVVRRIGLRPTPTGFGTPPFGDGEVVRVEGVHIVHERRNQFRRAPITTLADAAAFVGAPLGAPGVYTAATEFDATAPLELDVGAAVALADWNGFVDELLHDLTDDVPDAGDVTLWPEHFDVATTFAQTNFGGSPGDATIAEPYLYAGPWDAGARTGMFAAYPFGAALTYTELRSAANPHAAGREFLQRAAAAVPK